MKKAVFLLLGTLALILVACSDGANAVPVIGKTTIQRENQDGLASIPFEDVEVLKGFSSDSQLLDYNTARKIALVEFLATGMDKKMGWEGHTINPTPVVIYGFDNRPKFYDFIVLDAEEKAVGTITAYARRTATSSIRAVSARVKDYAGVLSKAPSSGAAFYEDWLGDSYLGVRGKSGEAPASVVNAESGEVQRDLREPSGEEMIASLMELFSALDAANSTPEGIDENDPLYAEVQAAIENSASLFQSPEDIEAGLQTALANSEEQAEAFWDALSEFLPDIEAIADDEEILEVSGKSFFSFVSGIVNAVLTLVTGVDDDLEYIEKYTGYKETFRNTSDYCGPWVCSYLLWIKNGQRGDTYSDFYSRASSFGELLFLNFALRAFGRPMTPAEMTWTLPYFSGGKIWFSDSWVFEDNVAYKHVKSGKPAILLCASGDQLHYRVAVGAIETGSRLFPTYKFLQHENADIGQCHYGNSSGPLMRSSERYYKTVEWWNPWFLVRD